MSRLIYIGARLHFALPVLSCRIGSLTRSPQHQGSDEQLDAKFVPTPAPVVLPCVSELLDLASFSAFIRYLSAYPHLVH
jgi:hypothetical protein